MTNTLMKKITAAVVIVIFTHKVQQWVAKK